MYEITDTASSNVQNCAFVFDADGVIVQWVSKLAEFAKSKGLPFEHIIEATKSNAFLTPCEAFSTEDEEEAMALIREYNSSKFIAQLNPMAKDVGIALNTISKLGKLILVTCIGTDPTSFLNRITNISSICGGNIFEEMHFLDVDESKESKLKELSERYDIGYFVDDRSKHVKEGLSAGVTSYQFALNTDVDKLDNNLNHVGNWTELIELAYEFRAKMELRQEVFA